MTEHITAEIEENTSEITYKRALLALPILVQQVLFAQILMVENDVDTVYDKQTMTYKQLGKEIDAHHRVVRHPLFCIEKLLSKLSEHWNEEIPAIQGLVVKQEDNDDLPGDSVVFFRDKKLDTHTKKQLVMNNFREVINYPKWTNVLEELGLQTVQKINLIDLQKVVPRRSSHESPQHKQLKEHVAHNPQCVGVEESLSPGKMECKLKSGDIPDVLFKSEKDCIAVEVKSRISDEKDLQRGLFQCVKYRAILEACRSLDNKEYYVDARLAIEGTLPKELICVKKTLDIQVYENIKVSNLL